MLITADSANAKANNAEIPIFGAHEKASTGHPISAVTRPYTGGTAGYIQWRSGAMAQERVSLLRA